MRPLDLREDHGGDPVGAAGGRFPQFVMKPMLSQALNETLDYLRGLAQEKIRPAEAKARLRALQSRHPEMPLELLWEEESFDKSVHYDALLGLAGEGTVSLSFCPDLAQPW